MKDEANPAKIVGGRKRAAILADQPLTLIGEMKDILVFDSGRCSNVIYMVT